MGIEQVNNRCKICNKKNFPDDAFDYAQNICHVCKKKEDKGDSQKLCTLNGCIVTAFAAMIIIGIGMKVYDKFIVHKDKQMKKYEMRGWDPLAYKGEHDFSKNSEHTVVDDYTHLIWQSTPGNMKRNFDSARRYCHELSLDGYEEWRLPDFKELYYLGDKTRAKPAIDIDFFHNIKNDWQAFYWSSDFKVDDPSQIWVVNFYRANQDFKNRSERHYVLCVHEEE